MAHCYVWAVHALATVNISVADPAKCIRGGSNFEIFSVRGGGGVRVKALDLSFQNLEFAFQ